MRHGTRRLILVASVALAVVGCVGPLTTASPSPSPSPTPTTTASPTATASAVLVVTADGTVECRRFPHGCLASFIIEPGSWTPPADWEPSDDTPSFGAQSDPWELDGRMLIGGPQALAPGAYTFGIAVSEINDIVGDPNRYLSVRVPCTRQVTIPIDATGVTVNANFDDPCSIEVAIESPSSTPTASPAGLCHHSGRSVDWPGPNYLPTVDYLARTAAAVVVVEFVGYGESFWSTPTGEPPSEQELRAGSAEVRTRIEVGLWTALRGDDADAERIVLSGYGTVGCSDWTTDQYPQFAVDQRYVMFLQPAHDSSGADNGDLALMVAWPIDAAGVVKPPADAAMTWQELGNQVAAIEGPGATPIPSAPPAPDLPGSLDSALRNRLHVFDAENAWFAARWPYSRGSAVRLPLGYEWYVTGLHVGLLKRTATAIEVLVFDIDSGGARLLGSFPQSDNYSAVMSPEGSVFYVHGSSGDHNTACSDCIDHGVIAFDTMTGEQRQVVAPRAGVIVRWNLAISPNGEVLMSVASTNSETVNQFARTDTGELLPEFTTGELSVEAMNSTHAFGYAYVESADGTGSVAYRMARKLTDGSTIRVPQRYNGWWADTCEDCGLQVAAPVAFAVDDTHFLFDSDSNGHDPYLPPGSYDVLVLDTESGRTSSALRYEPEPEHARDLPRMNYIDAALPPDWALLSSYSDDTGSSTFHALNLRDGTVINLGAVP